MKTFVQYLAENATTEMNVHQFPHLAAKYGSALTQFLEIANPAIREGQLGKHEYETIKNHAEGLMISVHADMKNGYITNDAWFAMPPAVRKAAHPSYEDDYLWGILNTPVPVMHMNGRLKKAEKTPNTPLKTAYVPIAKELKVIADAVLALKANIVIVPKRSKAEQAAHAAYMAPQSTKDAKALIIRIMTEMTDRIIEKYISDLYDKWASDLDSFFAKGDEERRIHLGIDQDSERARKERNEAAQKQHGAYARIVQRQPHYLEGLLGMIAAPKPTREGFVFSPSGNWKETLHEHAVAIAKDMQSQFVNKNVGKLASIVETKGNLDGNPHILSIQTDRGNVAGELRFKFTDGSSFVVRNKVVAQFRYTNSGVISFYQFPTTFHDAVLPDGKRMSGMPSEEQMNKIFAVAKG